LRGTSKANHGFPDEVTNAQRREDARTSGTRLQKGKDLNVVRDGAQVRVRLGSTSVKLNEELLVIIEAVLVGVRYIRDEVRIGRLRVTVVIEATTTVLLSRLATVRPIAVEIAAELRLASTVATIRGIKARIEAMDGGITDVVSDTLVGTHDRLETSGSRGSSPATVGVVSSESTLQKSAINAFVLTAGDISLVVAGVAGTTHHGLATVQR